MKYISLFAGIGGFDLALDRLGHECVWANEWDKYARQIYELRFNRKIDPRDIRLVATDELPDFDLLVGGFPCQAFSIAGKRLGFEDTRGTLFFEIARIIKDKRPKYFLLENVKGLLSHDNGKTLQTILATINELGYESEWKVFNSKNHGVPQNRERIFISGYIRGEPRPKILSYRYSNTEDIIQINNPTHSNNRIYDPNGISPALNTMQGGNRQPKIIGMMNYTTEKRVYDTPKEINKYLKKHKNKTINEIADYLKLPKTQVEHYFRTDNSRAIPTPEVWNKLKELFNFDDTWDSAVNETYTKQIEFEQTRRIYDTTISPTLTASSSDKIAIPVLTPKGDNRQPKIRVRNFGSSAQLLNETDISPTLTTSMGTGGGNIPVIIPIVHNLQTRNPDRPSLTRICDCGSGKLYQKCHGVPAGSGHISKNDGTTYCLDTGNSQGVEIDKKIRRLTEIECERLQGFPDNWTESISSTQRYKCLGNAVTVNVVYDIAKNYN